MSIEAVSAPQRDPRAEWIAGIRALANLVEATPDLPLPCGSPEVGKFEWNVWSSTTDNVPARIAEILRMLPGPFAKNDPSAGNYDSKYYRLTGQLRGLTLEIAAQRESVCERVLIGQRDITKEVPTATQTITVTEDIYEWRCHSILADAEPEAVPEW